MNNNNKDHDALTFVRLATALADDYESIYVINTDDDSYVEYSASGEAKELCRQSAGDDFYADTVKNCKLMVYPDDRQFFLEKLRKVNVMSALEGGRSFTIGYRLLKANGPEYYSLKTIRGKGLDDKYIVIGVRNVDAQVRSEKAAADESRRYSEIAGSLASLFEAIYHIDLNTGRYKEYSCDKEFAVLSRRSGGDDFFEMVERTAADLIHPDDYERIKHAMERKNVIQALKESGSFSLSYRRIMEGRPQYVVMLAIRQRNTSDRLVIGVRNVDEQMRRENAAAKESATYSHIAKALASRYEAIYYIDIENDEYIQYSVSEQYARLGTTKQGSDFFEDAKADILRYIHPEDVQRLLECMGKQKLLSSLEQTGSITLTYRQLLDGRPQYVTMVAVRPKNDDKHVIMGVFNVDKQIRHEQSIAKEKEAFGDIIRAMAQMYEVIVYVDVITGEYREYSHSDRYTKLDISTGGDDFFADIQRNMRDNVYHEDLPMMAESMKKENLLKSLAETGTTTLSYRLLREGKPMYVTLFAVRPKEDSDHIIIAVANVDASKRREIAYKEALGSAMDLASRDALTGVKNKHAYVKAEMEMDGLIAEGHCPDFAVLVADVNGLKTVNDTKGHHAGDEYIKAACKLICTTFKHSPVFRIGGDEFTVIMKGSDFEDRELLLAQLNDKMSKNANAGLVTAAAGASCYERGRDMRMQDVFERADNAMYENKKNFRERRTD